MQLCRKQCFLVFEMLALRFSSLTCCCYLHIQPLVFMCDICHWSNSLQLSNCFCLFPLAGKLIDYNWMVMCFSWVLLLVDIGVLYALCNKSVSRFIRVPCSKIAGLWHCLALAKIFVFPFHLNYQKFHEHWHHSDYCGSSACLCYTQKKLENV